MKPATPIATAAAVAALLLGAVARVYSAANADGPAVTAPPESFFQKVHEGRRGAARGFYKKYLDIGGMPVVAAAAVADQALHRTYEMVTHMLANRSDVLAAMADRGTYLAIIGKDQVYTDLPEIGNPPNRDYLNERVRGTAGLLTCFGEENLLSLPIDRYDDESIAVHEFSHTIDGALMRLDPAWRDRLDAVYRRALAKGLYRDTYAISSAGEYWAELVQIYFDCNRVNNWNHGPIGRREQLKMCDPEGYELVRSTFNLGPDQDWRYQWLQPLPNVEAPPAKFHIDPFYTKCTWAREFTVLGRGASDEALLKANDTIRKMFAYRHDILKALIADGVKLVVLGPNERLSDLPEYKKLEGKGLDHMVRFLDYSSEVKLLVVAQENVLGDLRGKPYGTECQIIRAFAKAIYHVTGTRAVDTEWEKRCDLQQYELRVQRMDVRFDRKLKTLYDAAMSKGRWKGTTAVHGRVEYWTAGVLAYFDAVGQGIPPDDAAEAIATRETLKRYDPDLFSLVDETMAYHGKVDWRYQSGRTNPQPFKFNCHQHQGIETLGGHTNEKELDYGPHETSVFCCSPCDGFGPANRTR
jgi:alpha-glucosidase